MDEEQDIKNDPARSDPGGIFLSEEAPSGQKIAGQDDDQEKAQLIRVKVFMNFPPFPGYSRT